jgi:protein SCO1/2
MLRRLFLPVLIAAMLAACGDAKAPPTDGPAATDFILQTAAGPLDSRSLRGKVLLIYFGYTHCPDVCPASLAADAQALNALTPAERARTKLLMVSVDPQRDTPAVLKSYAAFFHPEMIGATGSPAEIDALAGAFGAMFLRQPPDADGRYAVDHTTHTYLVGPDGRLAQTLPSAMPTPEVVAAIRKHLP